MPVKFGKNVASGLLQPAAFPVPMAGIRRIESVAMAGESSYAANSSDKENPRWNNHSGCELKLERLRYADRSGIAWQDDGGDSTGIVRYPYSAAAVCEAILPGEADRGILSFSTGIGMSIIAHRNAGIRASVCGIACLHVADSDRLAPGWGTCRFPKSSGLCGPPAMTGTRTADILPRPDPDSAARQAAEYLALLFHSRIWN